MRNLHISESGSPSQSLQNRPSYNEYPKRTLTGIFRRDGQYYEINCINSPCKTKCHFFHPNFGEAVFDRNSETLISTSKPLEDDYLLFLKRAVIIWKMGFPNF